MPEMKTVAVKVNSADNGYDIISGTDGKLTTPLEKDDTIIVAIQANNFDQFVQNSFGVQELSVALVYDTRYLEPTSTTNKKYITASKNFLAKDETNFMNQEIDGMYMVDTSTAKYAQDLASGETSILDSNTSNLKKAVLYVTCTPNSATDVNEQLGVITAGQLINFVEFIVNEVPDAGSKGVAITESSNLCLVMQNTGIFNKTWGGIDGLQEYMKINNSLNLFPAGAAKKTGISVKSGTMASTQFVGDVFKPGVDLQFDYSDGSHTDLGESDTVTYKYGAAGITAADNAGLTEIPATLTTDVNGKHIYAIVGNFICDLGELTVSEIKTTEITVSGAPTTAYDGTAINFKDLVAKITKNNGDTVTDIKFTNFENASNGLAIYKSNATGDVLEKVTAADKYAHGNNYFVVATTDKAIKSETFNVVSDYDLITLSTSTNNKIKSSYNADDAFDPSGLVIGAKKASESAATDVKYADFNTKLGSNKWLVVVAVDDTAAKSATASTTTVTKEMIDNKNKILTKINIEANKGDKIALIGKTGCGKTSLVNLICRFYDLSSGEILINEKNYKNYSLESLRSKIGYIMQNVVIFDGTILDNINYVNNDVSREEIINICKKLKIHDKIINLENGYDTFITSDTDLLSTGEKQLLNFARVMVEDPEIIILDEATASLSYKSEMLIRNAIDEITKNKISFIIAHRLSTIKECSQILYLDKGKIIEQGTHKELIDKKGSYFKLLTEDSKVK